MAAPAPPAPPPTLRSREPGYAAVEECLAAHVAAPRRSWIERLLGIVPLRAEAHAHREQALLERGVGALLTRLPADWTVLHSVPLPGGVVPHLVLGPAGVYAIFPQAAVDASVWVSADLIAVDGASSDALLRAEAAVTGIEQCLGPVLVPGVAVASVVVFREPKRIVVRTPARAAKVLDAAELVPWLRSLPELCSALLVDRLADAAELPTTWLPEGAETLRHALRWERLEAELAQAEVRRRRGLPILLATAVVLSAATFTGLALLLPAVLPG
ncbi:nuclease-related domain-containing protein [Naasia sp. SYSU D00057]|uniref:nuclease-related domain-containing protein n=1 Tax=Naasia sp. SYSU D00057 TaxID=2817380 RepID=UPI001B318237|nr:nuclease-related domain-containing protein [Naasia sp. SYSU D00057]